MSNRLQRPLTPAPLRRGIGRRVLAGFGLTTVLAAAVAFVSLFYNASAGRDLANAAQRDRDLAAAFRDLEVAVEQQSGAVQNFLLSGDERDLEPLTAGQARFQAALATLEARTGRDGVAGLDEIRQRGLRFDDIAAEELALYRQGWVRSANFLWRSDGLGTKAELLAAINRQTAAHNAAIDRQIATSRAHLRASLGLSLALVALAAGLALIIGMGIARGVTVPVRGLVRVADAVRGGDYSVRASIHGEDELAALSASFNAMVESLALSRARLEAALAETERSEVRYRQLAENANDIIFTVDEEDRFTFINSAVERILGYKPADLLGQTVTGNMYDSTRMALIERGTWTRDGDHVFAVDLDLEAADGRIVPMEVRTTVIRVDGRRIGMQGIARDMTERHRWEQELRRLHAQDRRRVDQLTTLSRMGRELAALQPPETFLPRMAEMVGTTFGYQHVRILLEGDGVALTVAADWQAPGAPPPDERSGARAVQRALRGETALEPVAGGANASQVALPIRSPAGVIGVLDVCGDAAAGLDDSDVATLHTLADQIAVALENARLYEAGQSLAVSEERNRLARELHDSVTQELFSMTMITGALPLLMERRPDSARERVQRLNELARGALAEMRALLFALRPAALRDEGLFSALAKHAAAVQSREGLAVSLVTSGEGRLPYEAEDAFFRVFQEALNNVVKHAHARAVSVRMEVGESAARLTVHDDGDGFDTATATPRTTMGMSSMRERMAAFGGTLTVESTPGAGTTLVASAPVTAAVTPQPQAAVG